MSRWERARIWTFLHAPRGAKRLAMWRLVDHAAAIRRRDEVVGQVQAAAGWSRFVQWSAIVEETRLRRERIAHLAELTRSAKLRIWKIKRGTLEAEHRRGEP